MTLDELAILGEVFKGSDLPYKVDLVDWQVIADGFRATIAGGRVALADER